MYPGRASRWCTIQVTEGHWLENCPWQFGYLLVSDGHSSPTSELSSALKINIKSKKMGSLLKNLQQQSVLAGICLT